MALQRPPAGAPQRARPPESGAEPGWPRPARQPGPDLTLQCASLPHFPARENRCSRLSPLKHRSSRRPPARKTHSRRRRRQRAGEGLPLPQAVIQAVNRGGRDRNPRPAAGASVPVQRSRFRASVHCVFPACATVALRDTTVASLARSRESQRPQVYRYSPQAPHALNHRNPSLPAYARRV